MVSEFAIMRTNPVALSTLSPELSYRNQQLSIQLVVSLMATKKADIHGLAIKYELLDLAEKNSIVAILKDDPSAIS